MSTKYFEQLFPGDAVFITLGFGVCLFNYYTDIETFSSERINGLLKLKF